MRQEHFVANLSTVKLGEHTAQAAKELCERLDNGSDVLGLWPVAARILQEALRQRVRGKLVVKEENQLTRDVAQGQGHSCYQLGAEVVVLQRAASK